MHIFCLHGLHQQTNRPYHNNRVRGFDGDHYIRELLFPTDTQELHTARHHTLRGISIPTHDAVGKRAMIHANTDGATVYFTNTQERNEASTNLLDLSRILLIRVFQMVECLHLIHIVARIDTHLLHLLCSRIGCLRVEMNICY